MKQGDIIKFDKGSSKGNYGVVISNNKYNEYFDTALLLPLKIMDSLTDEMKESPIFEEISSKGIKGAAYAQHVIIINQSQDTDGKILGSVNRNRIKRLADTVKEFF